MESDSVPFVSLLHDKYPTKCRKKQKNITDMPNVVKEITNER